MENYLNIDACRTARTITTILFDWDGTLVDSAHLGLLAFQKTFAVLGLPFPQQVYEESYSPNWYILYEALGLPAEKWDAADSLWLKHYGEQVANFIDGADRAIHELQAKGYQLGVVSSGSTSRLTREIEHFGLNGVFEVVVCNEQMVNKKPHPEGLQTAMRVLHSHPRGSCYVGDSPEDIEMGKSAAVMTVGVRSSYPTSWRVEEAKPDIWLENVSKITEHF